jgi:tRNA pseudouridine38-40 synthase
MQEAAKHFLGTHDFASFQATGSKRKSTVRTIHDILVEPERGRGGGPGLRIEVEANGFLYNMVRNIVGSLLEVGRGKESPDWIAHVRDAKNRDIAGPTAPPQGLFLMHVNY